jgi:hypothetical protein
MKCLSEKFFDRIYPKCKYELIHLTSNYYFRKEGGCVESIDPNKHTKTNE